MAAPEPNTLRVARVYLGLTIDEVSSFTGLPTPAIADIEAGSRPPDALELEKLARVYRRPPTDLLRAREASPDLPPAVARLTKRSASLSERDREELGLFAEFLAAGKSG